MTESVSAKPRIAVIGLGSMGFGMATSLRRAGLNVTGCDVSGDAVARFVADGGFGAKTPAEAAKEADIVVSVVVNAAQTETILFGAGGVAETLAKDAVFISSATMDPDVARRLASSLKPAAGIISTRRFRAVHSARRRANSPFSPPAARPPLPRRGPRSTPWRQNSTNSAMPPARCCVQDDQPVARRRSYRGRFEAITFAAKQGLDIRKVYEVITASAGNSWMFENRVPHVLDGDYAPRSAVEIFVKDLGIIQDMARTAKFPVPIAAAALQMFLMTAASGMGRDDDASVARMYARVTGTHLPGEPK